LSGFRRKHGIRNDENGLDRARDIHDGGSRVRRSEHGGTGRPAPSVRKGPFPASFFAKEAVRAVRGALSLLVGAESVLCGDVSLTLSHAGASADLLSQDSTDARENIYETYDIGVPSQPANSLDNFTNKPLQGDWYLEVTDNEPHQDNGILNTWRLYASYQAWSCTSDADCDDANLCTTDSCVVGVCTDDLAVEYCVIGGKCYAKDTDLNISFDIDSLENS
jgi:subtilisin-like proprotein convertase family protein